MYLFRSCFQSIILQRFVQLHFFNPTMYNVQCTNETEGLNHICLVKEDKKSEPFIFFDMSN